jgi:hypothetical protein
MRHEIHNLVFAGGGNRCLWQAGFYLEAAPALGLQPRAVAAASAGAAIACALFAGRAQGALERFKQATGANRRNAYPHRLLRGEPVFPHYAMYRRALLDILDPEAMARLHAGPDIRVPITRAPRWLGAHAGFAVAGLAEVLDHLAGPPVHPRMAPRLGFRAEYVRVRDCATPEDLAALILASSCTPPFTPALRFGGTHALDGGIADNVPVAALADAPGRTLVLLTRRFRRLPAHDGRIYVQPSAPIAVSGWDYTDPAGLQAAFDLGRRDGAAFVGAPVG